MQSINQCIMQTQAGPTIARKLEGSRARPLFSPTWLGSLRARDRALCRLGPSLGVGVSELPPPLRELLKDTGLEAIRLERPIRAL